MSVAATSFNVEAASKISGVSKRQVQYWDKAGLVAPSVQAARGRGSRRRYSFEDLLDLRVIARLRETGLSLQKVCKVVAHLHRHHRELRRPLAQHRLVTDGATVFRILDDTNAVEDLLQGGQVVVFVINLTSVWNETQSGLARISDPRAFEVRHGGKNYAVTLTPDLEDGGWVAECPSLPGCISQGDTLAEAKRMIREAIFAWLAAVAHERRDTGRGIAQRSRR